MAASDYMPMSYPDLGSQSEVSEWTGRNRWNAVYTIQLGELIDKGIFDWSLDILDWSTAAYSTEQYERVCAYFIERFRFREISIEPFYEWATMLHRKLVYEIMPKYKIMYKFLDDDFDIARSFYEKRTEHANLDSATTGNQNGTTNQQGSTSKNGTENADEYEKRRAIGSDYPETLLSGNADYVSNGQDEEKERISEKEYSETGTSADDGRFNTDSTSTRKDDTESEHETFQRDDLMDAYLQYQDQFQAIDSKLLDELESMFIGLYTASVDGM